MRPDMCKVLVERPRLRGWKKGRQECRRAQAVVLDADLEVVDYFSRRTVPIGGRRLRWAYKEFRDHMQPLRRYLEKQVGRPWDVVWQDICRRTDTRSKAQWHLRLHVEVEVDMDTHADANGQILVRGYPLLKGARPRLYIDPTTGLLCRLAARTERECVNRANRA